MKEEVGAERKEGNLRKGMEQKKEIETQRVDMSRKKKRKLEEQR